MRAPRVASIRSARISAGVLRKIRRPFSFKAAMFSGRCMTPPPVEMMTSLRFATSATTSDSPVPKVPSSAHGTAIFIPSRSSMRSSMSTNSFFTVRQELRDARLPAAARMPMSTILIFVNDLEGRADKRKRFPETRKVFETTSGSFITIPQA